MTVAAAASAFDDRGTAFHRSDVVVVAVWGIAGIFARVLHPGPRSLSNSDQLVQTVSMVIGQAAVIDTAGLDALIRRLGDLGYETKGPVVRDGAIVPGAVTGVAELPAGCHDSQAPGRYRLERGDDDELFGWAVGPGSWKSELFPPPRSCGTPASKAKP